MVRACGKCGDKTNAHKVLVMKPRGTRRLKITFYDWQNNIKLNFKGPGLSGLD